MVVAPAGRAQLVVVAAEVAHVCCRAFSARPRSVERCPPRPAMPARPICVQIQGLTRRFESLAVFVFVSAASLCLMLYLVSVLRLGAYVS